MRGARGTALAVVVVGLLIALVVTCERRLGAVDRVDPLGKELLYLPSLDMLKLSSLGNEGLAADLLYLWSIQYYSDFRIKDKFLYLETVYDLITDLDPLYFDAYRVGAMIMTIERGSRAEERKASVERLYDKGLAAMPGNWELAEVAAWDAMQQLRDPELAVHYAAIAAARPGAPPRVKRVYGRWLDSAGAWTVDDSIAYWQDVLAEAERWPDIVLAKNHLYDALARRDEGELNPMLDGYRRRFGQCAENWQQLVDLGWLREAPLDYVGNPYGIDQEQCKLQPKKRIRWKRE